MYSRGDVKIQEAATSTICNHSQKVAIFLDQYTKLDFDLTHNYCIYIFKDNDDF